MIGNPRRFRALDQFLQPPQMLAVGLLRRTEIHGHAVLHDLVLLQDLIQDAPRASAIDHEIFGNNLEPVAHRLARQDVVVVRGAQANADTVFGKSVKAIRRHCYRLRLPERRGAGDASPAPQQERSIRSRFCLRGLLFRHLAAVGCAAALAFARVLAFATIVAGLAAALALAGVLAFTSVLFFDLLFGLLLCILSGSGSLPPGEQIGSLEAGAGAREQARDRRTRE